jgi:hypothetical protein
MKIKVKKGFVKILKGKYDWQKECVGKWLPIEEVSVRFSDKKDSSGTGIGYFKNDQISGIVIKETEVDFDTAWEELSLEQKIDFLKDLLIKNK